MEAYFSSAVVKGLRDAKARKSRRKARFCVHASGDVFPILQLTENGFEVGAENTPHLRGYVDVYDGPAHLWQCLIVRADKGSATTRYEYKRQTKADGGPARDYAEERERTAGLLPKHPI